MPVIIEEVKERERVLIELTPYEMSPDVFSDREVVFDMLERSRDLGIHSVVIESPSLLQVYQPDRAAWIETPFFQQRFVQWDTLALVLAAVRNYYVSLFGGIVENLSNEILTAAEKRFGIGGEDETPDEVARRRSFSRYLKLALDVYHREMQALLACTTNDARILCHLNANERFIQKMWFLHDQLVRPERALPPDDVACVMKNTRESDATDVVVLKYEIMTHLNFPHEKQPYPSLDALLSEYKKNCEAYNENSRAYYKALAFAQEKSAEKEVEEAEEEVVEGEGEVEKEVEEGEVKGEVEEVEEEEEEGEVEEGGETPTVSAEVKEMTATVDEIKVAVEEMTAAVEKRTAEVEAVVQESIASETVESAENVEKSAETSDERAGGDEKEEKSEECVTI